MSSTVARRPLNYTASVYGKGSPLGHAIARPKTFERSLSKYLRANQNAERLHGVDSAVMNSPPQPEDVSLTFWTNSLTMQKRNKRTSYNNAKDFLQSLADNKKITQDGKEWLTLALDPFHDYNKQVAGYPDADASQTVVSCYQYQTDVSSAGGGNWDCHIYSGCVAKPDNLSVFSLSADWKNMSEPAAVQQNTWMHAPLTIEKFATSGNSFAPVIPAAANPTVTTLPALDNTDLCAGITRVIGMGFEVHNTTAELNKQGTITCYRMPQMGSQYQMRALNNGGTFVTPVVGEMRRLRPCTVAQANLLKGTRTWNAAEGAYCTVLQNSVHNPLKQLESQQLLYNGDATTGAVSTIIASQWDAQGPGAAAPAATASAFEPNQILPFDTTGLFLTGLSSQTTLTVKLKVYVERAPTWAEPNLAVLASPSAGYDVRALELYAQVVNCLPPGVKVSDNAFGDWWRAVVSLIKNAAPTIGLALNPVIPGAGLVGMGVGRLAGVVEDASNKMINTAKGLSISKQVMSQQAAKARINQEIRAKVKRIPGRK